MVMTVEEINKAILELKANGGSAKDISDGYHTFGDLYEHREELTNMITIMRPQYSWKSKQHHDGTMFDDSFIVGFNTPDGQYSYHYPLDHYDDFKEASELEKAPEYDGHKPEDIRRLYSIVDPRLDTEEATFMLLLRLGFYKNNDSLLSIFKDLGSGHITLEELQLTPLQQLNVLQRFVEIELSEFDQGGAL